jgi:5-methylcytosine-specific restriction enzyme A
MSRSTEEWIAKHDDQAIPPRVKLRVWNRCGGKCALSGRKLMPGDAFDYDHIRALCNGGEHRETNLQLVSRDKHREKTAEDVAERVKTERIRQKFLGIYPKSKTPLKSRNTFQGRAPR